MPKLSTPRLSDAADQFIAYRYKQGGSTSNRYGYKSLLRRFIAYTGDPTVGSLRPEHVDEFFYGPGGLSDSNAPTTLAKYRNDLKAFFRFCHRREWSAFHSEAMVDGIRDRRTRANRDRSRLMPTDILRMLDAADDPRDRALLAFVANTGVRISEAKAMRVRDIALNRGIMYVRLIKTGGEEVTYPITSDLDAELRVWLTHYAVSLDVPLSPFFYLFPARAQPRGNWNPAVPLPYRPDRQISNPVQIFRRLAERAGGIELEKGDGWHTIRRSVARWFFDKASDEGHDAALRMTQALLRHSNAATTEIYLGISLEQQKVMEVMQGKPFLTADDDRATVSVIGSKTKEGGA